MNELTLQEIRILQTAVDNLADNDASDDDIQKLVALHNKLEGMARSLLTSHTLDGVCTCLEYINEPMTTAIKCAFCGKPPSQ